MNSLLNSAVTGYPAFHGKNLPNLLLSQLPSKDYIVVLIINS